MGVPSHDVFHPGIPPRQVPVIAVSMTVSSVPAARDCASPFEEEDARHESLET